MQNSGNKVVTATIHKFFQYDDDGIEYSVTKIGTYQEIRKFAKSLIQINKDLDGYIAKFNDEGKNYTLTYWENLPDDPDYPDEKEHYWKYVVRVVFQNTVVKKCSICEKELNDSQIFHYGGIVCYSCKMQLESEVGYNGLRRILDK